MGAEASIELPKPFADIAKWQKSRVESVVKAYHEGEYDFGVDYSVVMSITGYDMEEAKELIAAHSKNDSGIINAVTLMITIIALGNSENRNEIRRTEMLFDLMDFNKNSKMSLDEMTILLLCIGSSFSFILEGTKISEEQQTTNESCILSYARRIQDALNKRHASYVSRDEFISFVKENIFGESIFHINDIYELMTKPVNVEGKEEDDEEGKNGKK